MTRKSFQKWYWPDEYISNYIGSQIYIWILRAIQVLPLRVKFWYTAKYVQYSVSKMGIVTDGLQIVPFEWPIDIWTIVIWTTK